jgi:hypothetical protein
MLCHSDKLKKLAIELEIPAPISIEVEVSAPAPAPIKCKTGQLNLKVHNGQIHADHVSEEF